MEADNIDVLESTERSLFSRALHHLKCGKKVTRKVWREKGIFVFLVSGSLFEVNRPPLLGIYPQGTVITYGPHLDICHADGSISPWAITSEAVLADDWIVLD